MINKKVLFILFVVICFLNNCATTNEIQREEYDTLASAVATASYAIIGEYGDIIPDDLFYKFMQVIKNNVPEEYFNMLKKYPIDIKPKGSYYLLLVLDPKTNAIILFDFSCTPEADGLILIEPDKYNLNNLEQYDPCK